MLHHVTQWNVNQASAILITTQDVAETYSNGSDGFIFPNALIESNAVIPYQREVNSITATGFIT